MTGTGTDNSDRDSDDNHWDSDDNHWDSDVSHWVCDNSVNCSAGILEGFRV